MASSRTTNLLALPLCKTHPSCRRTYLTAFTLIELLVVVAIVGILAGVLLPVFGSVGRSADKVACISNLRQVAAATNLAASDNNGNYPNLHGYQWEQGAMWIADGLAPYLGGVVGKDPTKVLRCPAAMKNQQETWLEGTQYSSYRYNVYFAQNQKPRYTYSNAMVFFDTTYNDWTPTQFAHSPGGGAYMDVVYADGHVAPLAYADYKKLNNTGDESTCDFFKLGWMEDRVAGQ